MSKIIPAIFITDKGKLYRQIFDKFTQNQINFYITKNEHFTLPKIAIKIN